MTTEPNYRRVGQLVQLVVEESGLSTRSIPTEVFACSECSALIVSGDLHTQWHASIEGKDG
jgi:hypothetical protein